MPLTRHLMDIKAAVEMVAQDPEIDVLVITDRRQILWRADITHAEMTALKA